MFFVDSIFEDIHVHIFSFLKPPDILSMRMTCRRMLAISKLRIIWTNACNRFILQEGYPFPTQRLERMTVSDLEQHTCHAFHLASRWLYGSLAPRRTLFIDSTSNTAVSDVRFIPGHASGCLLTISQGIWDILTIWTISNDTGAQRACEWSPRGALFSGVAVNTEPDSPATLAISIVQNDGSVVKTGLLMSLQHDQEGNPHELRVLSTIDTSMKPARLSGDLLAVSDDVSKTVIWNWKERTSAILDEATRNENGAWQPNRIIQVVFAHQSVLVVRACFINMFPEPELLQDPKTYFSIAHHSFGWIDGVCVTQTGVSPPTLSILLRGESDDPWSSGLHSLELYCLTSSDTDVSPKSSSPLLDPIPPYHFPPRLVSKVPAVYGSLRCRNVVLGPCGTAVWIQPQDRAAVGLTWVDSELNPLQVTQPQNGHEQLMLAAFPGPLAKLNPGAESEGITPSTVICTNSMNNWVALDYDEEMGRIALCSSFGKAIVLDL